MDISETYIKMCEKAEEIQLIKHPTEEYLHKSGMGQICHGFNGDFFWGKPTDKIVKPFVVPMPLAIWLPRQDQLQEMMKNLNVGIWDLFGKFGRWCSEWTERKWSAGYFTTGEQLWLAFYMAEKFSKVWDGEEWKLIMI